MKPERLFDFIYYQQEHHPMEKSVTYKNGNDWISFSTQEIIDKANALSRGLLKIGVQKGDKIAMVVYQNRAEWVIADIAISQIGAINVPVYPTISPKDYKYIFNDAGVSYVFAGKLDLVSKVLEAQKEVPTLKKVYSFDQREDVPFWEELFEIDTTLQPKVEELKSSIKKEELATLIYTSGTTGNPKGVMLSHWNIASNVTSMVDDLETQKGDTVLSFLPVCHVFERNVTYSYIYQGCSIYQAGTQNLAGPDGDILAVKPAYFTTVPRLLEKVYESIYNKGLALEGQAKEAFFWALSLAENFEFDKEYSEEEKAALAKADEFVFSKWRAALGGNIRAMAIGAAPCSANIIRTFSTAGIRIREGYGLTETSPTITINSTKSHQSKVGTVGKFVDGVDVMIEEDDNYGDGEGEILTSGPHVMMGYYNKPEVTAENFVELNGKRWFRTGDVGKIITNEHGTKFLKITDRKKELLKTSGGKYVAPAPIEGRLKEDFLVEQAMVVGEKKKFVSAIILPATEALTKWCDENGIDSSNLSEACKNQKVITRYQEAVDKANIGSSHTAKIKKFIIILDTWDFMKADGSETELTPTMKPKRRVIRKKYESQIDSMYL
ncbi:long-chain fatty acid--CoA ligase [Tenacibaculum holothuriorum]|uniref:Long-chain fatty acid--CoA ligase n=1 Tax=Tenacibaculum holothuriorum TaxID=1635173 RepID=A0A1Y2PCC4_9FLAO|nr:long-chain fatty acid--CoA ligase [Tenacibaculum holothuriorum]OSY87389.1 long-chain fatty acid--CoA ligase [Tenacibaculum holothuriorum]